MKAIRLHKIGEDLQLDMVDVPAVGDDEVLVKIRATGICHSDINYLKGIAKVRGLPITLGHEIAGVVAEKGARVLDLEVGDRVVIHYVLSCGDCALCGSDRETYCSKYQMIGKDLDGGFAEFIKVPSRNVLKIPESIEFSQAAIMGCAVSTAFHALRRGRASNQDTVVVYGVGGLGAHAVQLASKVVNVSRVIAVDILDQKLRLAKQFGANETVNSKKENVVKRLADLTDGKGADLVIDFVGRKGTAENAIACAAKGGRVVLVGISNDELQLSPYLTIIGKEMELVGVNDHLKSELRELIELVSSKRLDLSASVTHRVQLEDVNQGIRILEENADNPLRVVVEQ